MCRKVHDLKRSTISKDLPSQKIYDLQSKKKSIAISKDLRSQQIYDLTRTTILKDLRTILTKDLNRSTQDLKRPIISKDL